MDGKIHNFSDLIKKIKGHHNGYRKKILERYNSGAFFLRVIAARILWFVILYQLSTLVLDLSSPLKEFTVFILLGVVLERVLQALSEDIPEWFPYIYKGEFLCDFSLSMLNFSIFLMGLCGAIMYAVTKIYVVPLSISSQRKNEYGK